MAQAPTGQETRPGRPCAPLGHAFPGPGVPLLPKRALVLAQELLMRGVEAIKADS